MIKNNIIAYVIAVAVITIPVIPVVNAAPDTGATESSSLVSAPSTGGSTSSSAPSTGESASSAVGTAPSTGESTSSAGSTAPSTGDSTSTAGPADGSSTPVNEPNRSSGGGRRSSNRDVVVTTTPVVGLGTCPLITSYMKMGGVNNVAEVTKLQSFLKNVEKLSVDVTGTFDQKTEDAVKAFQLKYLPTVLGPWSATRATGNVYITTTKKINEIVCATPFVLSAGDLAIIEAYNEGRTTPDGQSIEIGQTGTSTSDDTALGTEVDENTDVAAVGEASALSRFWDFIKSLFR